MAKKVLILGNQGTLGQALEQIFSQAGYETAGWDKSEADVTSLETDQKIIALHPDVLIYAIGYNAVDKAETDPAEAKIAFTLNSEVPGRLAQLAKTLDITFIHYSTDYVFKGDKPSGYTESDQPDPQTVYGKSKFAGEKAVITVGGKYYLIRLSRLFGIKGASPNSKISFVDIMLQKAAEPQIKAKNEESGSPTYAPDLANFTLNLIENSLPYGIYHGANSGACNWFEWVTEIARIKGNFPPIVPVTSAEFPTPAKRPAFSALLNTKTAPMRTWQAALAEYLNAK